MVTDGVRFHRLTYWTKRLVFSRMVDTQISRFPASGSLTSPGSALEGQRLPEAGRGGRFALFAMPLGFPHDGQRHPVGQPLHSTGPTVNRAAEAPGGEGADNRDPVDPRPVLVVRGDVTMLAGGRCRSCRYPTVQPLPRCPVCGSVSEPADLGPDGTVFSATVLRIGVPGRQPPIALAYVDLDDGPRLLVHVAGAHDHAPAPGSRVQLSGYTPEGDPEVTVAAHAASTAKASTPADVAATSATGGRL